MKQSVNLSAKSIFHINNNMYYDEVIASEVKRYTDLNSATMYFLCYGNTVFSMSRESVEVLANSRYGYGLFSYGTRRAYVRLHPSRKETEVIYIFDKLGIQYNELILPIPYNDFERSFKCGGTRAWALEKFLAHACNGKWVGGFTGSNTTAIVPDGNGGTVQVIVKTDKRKITCDFVTAGIKAEVKLHGGSFSAGK